MNEAILSDNVRKAITDAGSLAYRLGDRQIGTEHLLFGLANATSSLASQILVNYGINADEVAQEITRNHESVASLSTDIELDYSPNLKNCIRASRQLAYEMGTDFLLTEHVLYSLLSETSCGAYNILAKSFHANIDEMIAVTWRVVQGESLSSALSGDEFDPFEDSFNWISNMFGFGPTSGGTTTIKMQRPTSQERTNSKEAAKMAQKADYNSGLPEVLRDMGIDLTARARAGKMDPIIGREQETNRIIEILCRKTKNNPVLIGEAGVGKSAVVEGLAQAIVRGNVPELLQNKIIFSFEIGSLMAGTKYRGSMEEKLKNAIETIISNKNIIVFIDEIHMLAQAGSKEGEVSPSDMLKPYLARGELQTIGATTTEEYRKFIEKDRALERRFQPIMVNQPSEEDTLKILKGIRDSYEAFHKVKITDEALEAAVNLSVRYIMDRFLPDKAIDLMDEAASRAKVARAVAPKDLKDLELQLKQAEQRKEEALRSEDFRKAEEFKHQADEVREKIKAFREGAENTAREYPEIGAEDVAKVVSRWTGIPVSKLTETERNRLIKLEDELHKRVIGQSEAVQIVSRAIRRARAGLKDPKRPIGTFIFLGPTGVGKTELTKAIAEAMFDDENNIIRLDMSEFMEPHSVAKLIGAPPGYVGHDDGGQLTKQVQRKPYSVVLFDEIEKAHPDVFNILLQMLDEGRLTDSQGTTVSFKNTIIILTSNVGVAELQAQGARLGFGSEESDEKSMKEKLLDSLKKKFKPEFLNRIDAVVVFEHLSSDEIRTIAKIMIDGLNKKLQPKGILLSFTTRAIDEVVRQGYDRNYGARPLRRVLEQQIEDRLAEEMLSGNVQEGDSLVVDFANGQFTFTRKTN